MLVRSLLTWAENYVIFWLYQRLFPISDDIWLKGMRYIGCWIHWLDDLTLEFKSEEEKNKTKQNKKKKGKIKLINSCLGVMRWEKEICDEWEEIMKKKKWSWTAVNEEKEKNNESDWIQGKK